MIARMLRGPRSRIVLASVLVGWGWCSSAVAQPAGPGPAEPAAPDAAPGAPPEAASNADATASSAEAGSEPPADPRPPPPPAVTPAPEAAAPPSDVAVVAGSSPSAKVYPPGTAPPSGTAPAHPGHYAHDGFYLRVALGGGALFMRRWAEADPPHRAPEYADSNIFGWTITTEITIGGMPRPDLVVGGTFYGQTLFGPELDRDEPAERDFDLGRGSLLFGLLGAPVDHFPLPGSGWHYGGTLGLAYAFAPASGASPFRQIGGIGPGVGALGGYDAWVSPDWAIGLLGRLTTAFVIGEATDPDGVVSASEDSILVGFSILATALYN